MKTFKQEGETLTLAPAAAVAPGVGYLFGTALFGVAINATAANASGEFLMEGVVTIEKATSLAISVGDRLYWDPAAKAVNKTTTAQMCVGVAVADASSSSGTVLMKLGAYVAVAA